MTAEEAHPRPSPRPSRLAAPVEEPLPETPVLLKPWLSSQPSRLPRFTSRPSSEASIVRRHERQLLQLREPIEEDFGGGQRRSRRTVRDHGLLQCPLGIEDRCQGLHWLRGVVAVRPAQCGDCRPTQQCADDEAFHVDGRNVPEPCAQNCLMADACASRVSENESTNTRPGMAPIKTVRARGLTHLSARPFPITHRFGTSRDRT